MKNENTPKVGQTVFLSKTHSKNLKHVNKEKTATKRSNTPVFIVDAVYDHGADSTRSVVVVHHENSKKDKDGLSTGPWFVANCKRTLGGHVIYELNKTGCYASTRILVEQKRRSNFDKTSADERRRGKLRILRRPRPASTTEKSEKKLSAKKLSDLINDGVI